MNQNDYDNNPKNIYMNQNYNQRDTRKDNNVIVEMEAENNEDESYYLSQSPVRRGKSNQPKNALSSNPSNLGMENAGNQQNQQHLNQYSPSSGGLGGKMPAQKKSNAHLNVAIANNGTIGGSTHGYGPLGGAGGLIKPSTSGNPNSMSGYNHHINVFKQNSQDKNSKGDSQMAFSKINSKLKKRQMGAGNVTGLQTSCNTNPGRQDKGMERDGSVDATSAYNHTRGNPHQQKQMRDNSQGYNEGAYMSSQHINTHNSHH